MKPKDMKKKLADANVTIQGTPEGSAFRYSANWNQPPLPELELWSDNKESLGHAMLAARMMTIEHGVAFEQDTDTGSITVTVGIKNPRVVGEIEQIDDLPSLMADVLEELTSGEADEISEVDAEDAAEEDARSGSVVPDRYKERYKEMGHPGTCGDWLALTLLPLTTLPNGKLDADAMAEIARLNGIDTAKLNRTTPGWQGRFRMTARNMLVKVVAKQGFLNVPPTEDGDQVKAPGDWLAVNQPKVKEAGNKTRKPDAA